jgi:hypothetical protein
MGEITHGINGVNKVDRIESTNIKLVVIRPGV